jgi:hypothetical protein
LIHTKNQNHIFAIVDKDMTNSMIDVLLQESLHTALGIQTMDQVIALGKRRQVQIVDNRETQRSTEDIFLQDQKLIDEL